MSAADAALLPDDRPTAAEHVAARAAVARILAAAEGGLAEPLAAYARRRHASGLVLLHADTAPVRLPPGARAAGRGNVLVLGSGAQLPKPKRLDIAGADNVVFVGPQAQVAGLDVLIRGSGNLVYLGAFSTAGGVIVHIATDGKTVRVGDACMISNRVILGVDDRMRLYDAATGAPLPRGGDVRVDAHVWVGRDVVVTNGARIGADAVLGQGAVAVGALDGGTVHAGAPARPLRRGITWSRTKDGSLQELEGSRRHRDWLARRDALALRIRALADAPEPPEPEATAEEGWPDLAPAEPHGVTQGARPGAEDGATAAAPATTLRPMQRLDGARLALDAGRAAEAAARVGDALAAPDAGGLVAHAVRQVLDRLAAAGVPLAPLVAAACANPAAAALLPMLAQAALMADEPAAALAALDAPGVDAPGVDAPGAQDSAARTARAIALAMSRDVEDPEREAALRAAMALPRPDPLVLDLWFHGWLERRGLTAVLAAAEEMAAARPPAPIVDLRQRWARVKPMLHRAADPEAAQARLLWRQHAAGGPLDRAACAAVTALRFNHAVGAAFLLRPLRQVPLFSAHPVHRALLAAAGVDAGATREAVRRLLDYGSPAWRAVMEGEGHASAEGRRRAQDSERGVGYQDRIVAEGALALDCPYGGGPCEAFDSLQVQNTTLYAFRGRHLFHLVAVGFSSRLTALILPAHDLVLTFSPMLGTSFEATRNAGTLARLVQRLAQHPEAFEAAAAAAREPAGRREVIAVLPHTANFAHQVWNNYSGLERQAAQGAIGNIARVIRSTGDTEFYGPLANLFPELVDRPIEQQPAVVVDPEPFSRRHILAPMGGYFLSAGFIRRLMEAMRRLPPAAGAPELPPTRPLVWIGVRVTDKAWIGQEEGTARLIQGVLAEHPGAHFVLDGFTFPVGADHVSDAWRPAIARMEALVEEIRRLSGRPERVISLVGLTLREAALWAEATDAYLAPIGTTQHKVGWFSGAPGVVYCNSTRVVTSHDLMPGGWEAEGIQRPTYLIGETVADADHGVKIREARKAMENLRLDPERVLAEVLAALARGKAR